MSRLNVFDFADKLAANPDELKKFVEWYVSMQLLRMTIEQREDKLHTLMSRLIFDDAKFDGSDLLVNRVAEQFPNELQSTFNVSFI